MKRLSRFFCESCGAEVSINSKCCPRCGGSFVSVRCQACGFEGEERFFDQGCPACGYRAPSGMFPANENRKEAAGALPIWVYALTFLALLAVGLAVFFTLK